MRYQKESHDLMFEELNYILNDTQDALDHSASKLNLSNFDGSTSEAQEFLDSIADKTEELKELYDQLDKWFK